MQVNVNQDTFPHPTLFVVASRAAQTTAPPVQPVGVFIAKQTVSNDGAIDPDRQAEILMTDVMYSKPDGAKPESHLDLQFESDLASTKPMLDVVAVRGPSEIGRFGTVRIKRNSDEDFGGFLSLDYGWRSRMMGLRAQQAGDVAGFQPDVEDPFRLPQNFSNAFFNGGHLSEVARLQAGDSVEFTHELLEDEDIVANHSTSVTVPAGPSLEVRIGQTAISPPVSIDLSVDTVVYDFRPEDLPTSRFLITWRAIFEWEDRLANAPDTVLEVS